MFPSGQIIAVKQNHGKLIKTKAWSISSEDILYRESYSWISSPTTMTTHQATMTAGISALRPLAKSQAATALPE
jgi:hypothetical protein